MSAAAIALRRVRLADALPVLGVAALAVAVGVATVARPSLALVAAVGVCMWTTILLDWRRGVLVLGLALPFSGVPSFLTASHYAPLAKDILVVLPLYLSFAAAKIRQRRSVLPRGDNLPKYFAVLAVLAVLNVAASPSLVVGAIGLRVWLLYLPLYLVGYHWVRSTEDFVRFVRLTAVVAIIPVALGIAEFLVFLRTGGLGPFLGLYGPLRDAAGGTVTFGQTLSRVPSTFTFAASYYDFCLVALAAAASLWLGTRRRAWAVLVLLFALGAVTSGIRRSYVTVPLLLAIAVGVGGTRLTTKLKVGAALTGLVACLATVGVKLGLIVQLLPQAVDQTIRYSLGSELGSAARHAVLGAGTGYDTEAAIRYGGLGPQHPWLESGYAKALVEFGLGGLVLVLAMTGSLLARSWRGLKALDPRSRALGAPLLGLLAATALLLAKAAELDWDPLNMYFWLFAGLLMGLVEVRATRPTAEAEA